MNGLRARILASIQTNGTVPPDLTSLPLATDYTNDVVDGWGQPIQLSVVDNKYIVLRSLGADRIPGGAGEDADMEGRFLFKKDDGKRCVMSDGWSKPPR
jgi:hypothetical protein